MLNYILVGVIVVLGAYIFLLERNRKRLIQMLDEDFEESKREREEHYARLDEERQEQEDKEQELIKELRKNKIQQACSLFRVMFRRYCDDVPELLEDYGRVGYERPQHRRLRIKKTPPAHHRGSFRYVLQTCDYRIPHR